MLSVKIKKCRDGAVIPQYATDGSACFDLHACFDWEEPYCDNVYYLSEHEIGVVINTGLKFEIPEGHVMMIYSRSGHGFTHNVRLANCVGVIDSDYRGEVKVKLNMDDNYGDEVLIIHHGDRIAQAMIIPVQQVKFEEVSELSDTERGTGGLGSTGK